MCTLSHTFMHMYTTIVAFSHTWDTGIDFYIYSQCLFFFGRVCKRAFTLHYQTIVPFENRNNETVCVCVYASVHSTPHATTTCANRARVVHTIRVQHI